MAIKYIVYVKTATGEITDIQAPGGVIHSGQKEGAIESSNPPTEIFHVYTEDTQGLDNLQQGLFMQNYYRYNNAWAVRGAPPTEHYTWDTTNRKWVFDSKSFWQFARMLRNQKLQECDWTQANDTVLATHQVLAWQSYRDALRNIPSEYSFATSLDDITWPTPPE
jgi:hypothetical protein